MTKPLCTKQSLQRNIYQRWLWKNQYVNWIPQNKTKQQNTFTQDLVCFKSQMFISFVTQQKFKMQNLCLWSLAKERKQHEKWTPVSFKPLWLNPLASFHGSWVLVSLISHPTVCKLRSLPAACPTCCCSQLFRWSAITSVCNLLPCFCWGAQCRRGLLWKSIVVNEGVKKAI